MRRYRSSRWKQLIFPQELLIDKYHVLSRKRHFPAFWVVTEESIPLSKLASIQIQRGFLFSKLIIENSGGPYPIVVDGIWNNSASEARDLLEMIERETQGPNDIGKLVGEASGDPGDSPRLGSGGTGGTPSGGPGNNPPETKRDTRHDAVIVSGVVPDWNRDVTYREPAMKASAPATPRLDFEITNRQSSSPAMEAIRELKSSNRKFGELPCDEWKPPAPWQPKEQVIPELPEEISCQHEVLSFSDAEITEDRNRSIVALEEPDIAYEDLSGKVSPVEQLTNWWDNTKATFKVPELPRPKRHRRKLN